VRRGSILRRPLGPPMSPQHSNRQANVPARSRTESASSAARAVEPEPATFEVSPQSLGFMLARMSAANRTQTLVRWRVPIPTLAGSDSGSRFPVIQLSCPVGGGSARELDVNQSANLYIHDSRVRGRDALA
jgi:hypothetical protein